MYCICRPLCYIYRLLYCISEDHSILFRGCGYVNYTTIRLFDAQSLSYICYAIYSIYMHGLATFRIVSIRSLALKT